MKSVLVSMALVYGLVGQILADETKPKAETPTVSPAEKLKANPDDKDALLSLTREGVQAIASHLPKDPDAAEKKQQELLDALSGLEPTTDEGKATLKRYLSIVKNYSQQIELARTSQAELEARLNEKPLDKATLTLYVRKVLQTAAPLVRREPKQAEEIISAAKARLQKLIDATEDEAAQALLKSQLANFSSIQRTIDVARQQAELIGKDAAPLEVDAWANGSPLTDAELKGKVVLLDFWAVWCGPCIATFPHLRQWQQQYADKGLVIIGLTRYYNYAWDEEDKRASKSDDPVEPAAERAMLEQFAAEHDLHHRFALQTQRTLSDYYGVSGIPQYVVIDQQGKIRLIRVGSGDENAKDISQMLEQLMGAPAAASSGE